MTFQEELLEAYRKKADFYIYGKSVQLASTIMTSTTVKDAYEALLKAQTCSCGQVGCTFDYEMGRRQRAYLASKS